MKVKFNLQQMGKNLSEPGAQMAVMTASILAAQKFADVKKIFPNVDPEKWYIKHQGLLKVGGVLITMAMWNKMPKEVRWILMGLAIQGAIQAAVQYTKGETGESFFQQIGNNNQRIATDEEMEAAAKEILDATNQYPSGVAGVVTNMPTGVGAGYGSQALEENATTGVAGMGMNGNFGGFGNMISY